MKSKGLGLPLTKSIRGRVILKVSGLIALAMLFITLMVALLVYQQMGEQMQTLLQSQTYATQQRLEQRLRYLAENTVLLTKNEFMINALIDAGGRETYLPPLVENFMEGKDVVSLSVVDFDGRPIFKTQKEIPQYNSSAELRAALAQGQVTSYIQPTDHQMVLVAPIEYYATTQGAVVVVFDLPAIVNRNLPEEKHAYIRLVKTGETVYTHGFDPSEHYRVLTLEPSTQTHQLLELGLALELGLPENIYSAPVKAAVVKLLLIAAIFIAAGLLLSIMMANSITRPILELYRRVTASTPKNYVPCSPIGTDDELEALARAFDERSLMLQYQAEHDALTDLPNRVLFLDRVKQSIRFAEREGSKLAVLFLDLDRFKEVNDSLGHDIGDVLLRDVSIMLHESLRSSDTIARMGGDEFAILIDRIEDEDIVVDIIQKIMQRFREVMPVEKFQLYVTCSIGATLYPDNGETPELLLKNADAAMYRAKAEGRNTYQFYTQDMTEKAYERVMMETELRRAIAQEEFEVHYQPQTDMRTGGIIGMEALIRWRHPESGLIPPFKFIPLAEETGLIIEIDRWVMRTAMAEYVSWKRAGLEPGKLSLNLSLLQFQGDDFIDAVADAIDATNFSPTELAFEVTETQIMKNPDRTIRMLDRLKAFGIGIAVDDFGTGQSSLSYLKRLPVDKVKIDQSFVRDIPDNEDDVKLTKAIIAMAKSLKLDVIAEGVETRAHAEFLTTHGCFEAQGYYYFKPQPARDIISLLTSQQ